ncbi:MAG: CaiB/BaiF CoA-transferase family protein [Geminicoccaceae bacterium]|nr:CaiB/BaiF CoA-transferase family protein [Geminicoccaceae bacterium]
MAPLDGVRVLDFSTLLPGPMATLLLAEAGAEVIKIERPGSGDEMRGYEPKLGTDSANFALLNRGKRSIALDLKDEKVRDELMPLIEAADVLVEQFRPGVMDRLRLGYGDLKERNPKLIYCSITGYGQDGPKAGIAAHDLNYIAEVGLLGLAAGEDGAPVVPPALIADIAGGSWPAVINILLALHERSRTGQGRHLDVSMTDNLFPFMYWALGSLALGEAPPKPGGELVTGGSPRYAIYRTADGRYLAAAPLEKKFWRRFTELIGLAQPLRDDEVDPAATRTAVAAIIQTHDAAHWRDVFDGEDVCCSVVMTLEEALTEPHVQARRLFEGELVAPDGRTIPALPVPLDPAWRGSGRKLSPALGEASPEDIFRE